MESGRVATVITIIILLQDENGPDGQNKRTCI